MTPNFSHISENIILIMASLVQSHSPVNFQVVTYMIKKLKNLWKGYFVYT
jgi:hypothetical protein